MKKIWFPPWSSCNMNRFSCNYATTCFVRLHPRRIISMDRKKWFGNWISFQVWHHFSGLYQLHRRWCLDVFLAGEAGEGFSLQSSLELAGLEMSEEARQVRFWRWNLGRKTWGIFCFWGCHLTTHPTSIVAQWRSFHFALWDLDMI